MPVRMGLRSTDGRTKDSLVHEKNIWSVCLCFFYFTTY